MTEERRQELVAYRQQNALKDQQRELTGQLIDGIKQIEEGLARPAPVREALPEMVMAGRGGGNAAKGKRVTVRR
jgi:small subunit ribosomal protein S35